MFFAIIVLIITLTTSAYSRSILDDKYAIIFDGGSKGTRLYLLRYQITSVRAVDQIEEKLYCEINDGGLGSYTDVAEIAPKFSACMNKASDLIPEDKKPSTFISLIATAGMRLLEIKNKTHSDNILRHLRLYFSETEYLYKDPSQVKIIGGHEEGIYSFIATNYKNDFKNVNAKGILDLGGASTQLAFLPTSVNLNNEKYLFDVKLNNHIYKIYSHSFLCFGTAQILTMYNSKILKDSQYSSTLKASCYPTGFNQLISGNDLLETPCVNGLVFEDSFDFSVDKNMVESNQTYRISGNSKKNKCREEIDKLIPQPQCQYGHNDCSFNGVYLPPVSESQFLAMGNFYEAIDLTSKLFNQNFNFDMNGFNKSTYLVCSMTYTELKNMNDVNKAGISKKRLAKLCLENVYILRLFELYGFKSLSNVNAIEQVNNVKINWILGYLISELNSDESVLSLKLTETSSIFDRIVNWIFAFI